MSEGGITATVRDDGGILLTMGDGETQVQIELSIEAAEDLKAQVGAALITAGVRAKSLERRRD